VRTTEWIDTCSGCRATRYLSHLTSPRVCLVPCAGAALVRAHVVDEQPLSPLPVAINGVMLLAGVFVTVRLGGIANSVLRKGSSGMDDVEAPAAAPDVPPPPIDLRSVASETSCARELRTDDVEGGSASRSGRLPAFSAQPARGLML
jgi:hypothetical protein